MITERCEKCCSCLKSVINDAFDTRYGTDSFFKIGFCSTCDIVKTFPTPKLKKLRTLYKNYYNFTGKQNQFYKNIRKVFFTNCFYRLWMLLDGDISFHSTYGKGSLLDLGCNEGRGLDIYKKNGFNVEGLELNDRAASAAKKKGFTVFSESIENLEAKKSYDVVVLSNVLEHSVDPYKMLDNIYRILKPGGEVWISCPNVESWQRILFGRFSFTILF